MTAPSVRVLGLIAGQGTFPLEVARSARTRGHRVVAVAFRDQTDPRIDHAAAEVTWLYPGEVMKGIGALRAAGVERAVMAGKVAKTALFEEPGALRLDARAAELMDRLPDRRDDSILGLVADFLAGQGIHLLGQAELVPEVLAGEGALGETRPTREQWADVAFGWPIAKQIAALDIGQTVVVKDRAVLALEAIEGTDAAIRRGSSFAHGACVVKVAKPRQDPRFDVPTIGLGTAAVLVEARVSLLAFEAGSTVVLDREALVREADAHGIALVGVDPEKLPAPGDGGGAPGGFSA